MKTTAWSLNDTLWANGLLVNDALVVRKVSPSALQNCAVVHLTRLGNIVIPLIRESIGVRGND
jgi:hypothetical protein